MRPRLLGVEPTRGIVSLEIVSAGVPIEEHSESDLRQRPHSQVVSRQNYQQNPAVVIQKSDDDDLSAFTTSA
jgi:hypothetical protein